MYISRRNGLKKMTVYDRSSLTGEVKAGKLPRILDCQHNILPASKHLETGPFRMSVTELVQSDQCHSATECSSAFASLLLPVSRLSYLDTLTVTTACDKEPRIIS